MELLFMVLPPTRFSIIIRQQPIFFLSYNILFRINYISVYYIYYAATIVTATTTTTTAAAAVVLSTN